MISSYNHDFIFWILTKHISTLLIITYISHCWLILCAQFNDFWEVQCVARQQYCLAIEPFCHSKRKSLAHTLFPPWSRQPPAYFLPICISIWTFSINWPLHIVSDVLQLVFFTDVFSGRFIIGAYNTALLLKSIQVYRHIIVFIHSLIDGHSIFFC